MAASPSDDGGDIPGWLQWCLLCPPAKTRVGKAFCYCHCLGDNLLLFPSPMALVGSSIVFSSIAVLGYALSSVLA